MTQSRYAFLKQIGFVCAVLLLIVLCKNWKHIAVLVPGVKPIVMKTERAVDLEVIKDSASQKVWGLCFSSYYRRSNLEVEAVEEFKSYYWLQKKFFILPLYAGHSMDADGKRRMLLYFRDPIDTAGIPPKYDYVFRELKDQAVPAGAKMKIVLVDPMNSLNGYKLESLD